MEQITDFLSIKQFLLGIGTDYKGRTLSDIWQFTNIELEECHDQIQWLFPLHENSNYALVAPIINKEFINYLINEKALGKIQANLIISMNRLQNFLGLAEYYNINQQKEWAVDFNHNLLRITRMIRSLRLFQLDAYANDLFIQVQDVAIRENLSPMTSQYWNKALKDQIWNSLR